MVFWIRDVESRLWALTSMFMLHHQCVSQPEKDIGQFARPNHSNISKMVVVSKQRRRGAVSKSSGLWLVEDAVADCIPDRARDDVLWKADSGSEIFGRDTALQRYLLRYIEPQEDC